MDGLIKERKKSDTSSCGLKYEPNMNGWMKRSTVRYYAECGKAECQCVYLGFLFHFLLLLEFLGLEQLLVLILPAGMKARGDSGAEDRTLLLARSSRKVAIGYSKFAYEYLDRKRLFGQIVIWYVMKVEQDDLSHFLLSIVGLSRFVTCLVTYVSETSYVLRDSESACIC
eukprot:scaffold45896_cov21-Prasinocladus_malaysianus.AAC.1